MMIEQLNKLLRRYKVTFSSRISQSLGTSATTPYYDVTVVAENDGRKLTGQAWDKTEILALDAAFTRLMRQVDALDELE